MRTMIAIVVTVLWVPLAVADDAPDLLGRWLMEGTSDGNERCGKRSETAELNITKQITARAYRGNIRTQAVWEKCSGVAADTSGLTVRIRDGKVNIEYDEAGWAEDDLVLDGLTMTGSDSTGFQSTWVKQVAAAPLEPTIDMSEIDAFLDELKPDYTRALRAEFGAKMLQNLRRTGLSREEAMEVALETLGRMTDCVVGLVREEVVAKSIPLADIQRNRSTIRMLEPSKVDYREIECVHDAATNAGVIIH